MPKGVPNKIYSGQFKVKVVDTMYAEHLSCPEEARRFSIQSETQVARWESIYPEEEKEALLVERRERACAASRMLKGRKPKRDIYLQINLVKHNPPFFDVLKSSVSKRRGKNSDLGSY